jgi:hypothetical protein
MGVAYNNRIVTDGLVLALDAGNNKSHSTNRYISYGSGLVTEAVNFAVQGVAGFQRVAVGTVIGGYAVKSSDVVYSYALGTSTCHYHGNTAPIPAGVYATFTFDYLVTGATTYPITDYLANFENYGGGALTAGVATLNNLQNVWQRVSFTSGPTSSAGTQAMFLYPGGCVGRLADSGTIYFRNPRVEFSSVDTGTGNFSSMTNLTTWYDLNNRNNNGTLTNGPYHLIGNNADGTGGYMSFDGTDDNIQLGNASNFISASQSTFTINSWVKTNVTGAYKKIFTTVTAGTASITGVYFSLGPSPDLIYLGIVTNNGGAYASSSSSISTSQYFNLCGTYDGSNIRLYLNGTLVATQAQTGNIVNTGIARISGYDNNTEVWNGNIAQLSIYNKALTAAEVQQNFNATRLRFGI